MPSADLPRKGQLVWSRGRKFQGRATGKTRRCTLEGCRGIRIYVRWPDSGRLTYPCLKGMKYNPEDDSWEIE